MNSLTKWVGRCVVAGVAALMVMTGAAFAQDQAAPPAAPPAAAAPAAPAEAPAAGAPAAAAPAAAPMPKIDSGDTAWMITSSALVLMMTIPGLALFYGGMVRKKNVLATLAQSFGATCIITVLWMIIGYSIAFTANPNAGTNAFIGGFSYLFLVPMGLNAV
ncbi:MAG TPA: hypothetical protein VEU06_00825, partial [Micropepsaceae bacterium]|nr:hypothetical protein [Micropepsaceae bacterium]